VAFNGGSAMALTILTTFFLLLDDSKKEPAYVTEVK